MLDQIIVARTVCGYIGNKLPHNVKLVIAGKDKAFFLYNFLCSIRLLLLLLNNLQVDELLENIHHAVFLKDFFPQV